MLDTDTASYLLKGLAPAVDERAAALPAAKLCISAITRAELLLGVQLKPGATRLAQLVDQLLLRIRTLPWDETAADRFAGIAAKLHRAGTPIGTLDTQIAAHALAAEAVLVTNNLRHFERVPGLALENWVAGH